VALIGEAREAALKAEGVTKPLAAKDCDLSPEGFLEAAAAAEAELAPARGAVERALEQVTTFEGQTDLEEELKGFQKNEVTKLRARVTAIQGLIDRVSKAIKLAKERSAKKAEAKLEALRQDALTALRKAIADQSKTSEGFFESLAAGGESLTCAQFVAFMAGVPDLKLEDGQGEKLFRHMAEDSDAIAKDRFVDMLRLYYKVVKATVLTESLSIKSKTMKRLDVGEVLEGLEGPSKDDASGVQRHRCRIVQEGGLEGWVTLAGNQGTQFLELGGNLMTCVKETTITDGLSIAGSKTIRNISQGEVIEVREWPKKEADAEVLRVKGKAKKDGTIGWVTVAGNAGTTFLEVC